MFIIEYVRLSPCPFITPGKEERYSGYQAKTNNVERIKPKCILRWGITDSTKLCVALRDKQQLELNGKVIERVEELVYLGTIVSRSFDTDEETRITLAKGVFAELTPIWWSSPSQPRRSTRIFGNRTAQNRVLCKAFGKRKAERSSGSQINPNNLERIKPKCIAIWRITDSTNLCIGLRDNQQLELNRKVLERVEEFVYLGTIVSTSVGTDEDTARRIKKTKGVFAQVGRSTRIFRNNVTSILLCGFWTSKVTKYVSAKLEVVTNRCLRRI